MSKADSSRKVVAILSIAQYNRLAAKAEETGAPIAELIRRALDASLNPPKRKEKAS